VGSAVLSHCMKLGGTGLFHYKVAVDFLKCFPAVSAVLQSLEIIVVCGMQFKRIRL